MQASPPFDFLNIIGIDICYETGKFQETIKFINNKQAIKDFEKIESN